MAKRKDSATDDFLHEARKCFEQMVEAENHNRAEAEEDIRFARLAEQWPDDIRMQRQRDGRPCLTINKLPAFIRQVVNDCRQNKPAIKVHPADSAADIGTAKILNGVIRHIEYASSADVAYDWAIESAVTCGFGYFIICIGHAHDDSFDLDVQIDRVLNPFSVYGDPNSTAADSSDWNKAFVVNRLSHEEFEREYRDAEKVDWDGLGYGTLDQSWYDKDTVQVADYWIREEIEREICRLSNGAMVDKAELAERVADTGLTTLEFLAAEGIVVTQERTARSWRVRKVMMTGAEVLAEHDWPGRFIPIVPVYGDEVYADGNRHFRSLIRDAKDPQRMFNYWRTTATELVALAPRSPWVGPEGSFKGHEDKWATANSKNHPYLEYKPVAGVPPQRQPLDTGPAAGALQEALNAADDIKSIIGIYDASLGARSNETTGRAILARQREGDVSTFHFIDNLSRAIRHAGRVLIDLIPTVYNKERIIRVIGEDGTHELVRVGRGDGYSGLGLGEPSPVGFADTPSRQVGRSRPGSYDEQPGNTRVAPGRGESPIPNPEPPIPGSALPMSRVYDLAKGKYDLTVDTGPSFTTRREEAATQMTELIRAFPQAAPVLGDLLAKNLDWPGADEIAERLKMLLPAPAKGGLPPQAQKILDEGKALIQKLEDENGRLKADLEAARTDRAVEAARVQLDGRKIEVDRQKLSVEQYEAETRRMEAVAKMNAAPASQMPARNGPSAMGE
jgi:hypothetical protein